MFIAKTVLSKCWFIRLISYDLIAIFVKTQNVRWSPKGRAYLDKIIGDIDGIGLLQVSFRIDPA